MNSDVAKKVYPTIINVLDVLERINNVRGQAPSIDSVRVSLKGDLSQFGSKSIEEQLMHRALVYFTDEMLTESRWGDYWKNNLIEFELFGTRNRAELFFRDADQASALGRTDTLETFFLCAALGFQGIYRAGGGARASSQAVPVSPAPAGPVRVPLAPDKAAEGPETTVAINFDEKTVAHVQRGPIGPPILDASRQASGQGPRHAVPTRETPFASGAAVPRGGLQEWAQRVYERLRPKGAEKYAPAWAPESAGDCRPLRGRRLLSRMLSSLVFLGLFSVVLIGAWLLG
jgi:hypothetical protein